MLFIWASFYSVYHIYQARYKIHAKSKVINLPVYVCVSAIGVQNVELTNKVILLTPLP